MQELTHDWQISGINRPESNAAGARKGEKDEKDAKEMQAAVE